MLFRKAFFAPPGEEGSDTVEDQVVDTGGTEEGGSPEPQSLRQQLENNFEADRKATAKANEKSRDKKSGYTSRARQAAAEDAEQEGTEQPEQQQQQQQVAPPPEAFAKEAKAEWANVPPTVQAAIIKREEDVARGVQQLQQRYADIDQAIQPFAEQIRAGGKTPAQAVGQLFAWFNALANNPKEAFPALAKSFGYQFGEQAPVQGQQPQGQQPEGEVPPAVQQYINSIEQKLQQMGQQFSEQINGVQQTFAAQNQAKTQEILDNWSRDKKYFPQVRQTMARLIQSGEIPLNNGQVDLDKAYETAVWAVPDVRSALIADQKAAEEKAAKDAADAERKAQQAQAEKARKAGVGLAGGAPGAPAQPGAKGPKGKGKSVRESILEAREQLNG